MKLIFADTFYWIALINPRDNWHFTALDYAQKYADDYLITTDGIVDETLNYVATKGSIMPRKSLATCPFKSLKRRIWKLFLTRLN